MVAKRPPIIFFQYGKHIKSWERGYVQSIEDTLIPCDKWVGWIIQPFWSDCPSVTLTYYHIINVYIIQWCFSCRNFSAGSYSSNMVNMLNQERVSVCRVLKAHSFRVTNELDELLFRLPKCHSYLLSHYKCLHYSAGLYHTPIIFFQYGKYIKSGERRCVLHQWYFPAGLYHTPIIFFQYGKHIELSVSRCVLHQWCMRC